MEEHGPFVQKIYAFFLDEIWQICFRSPSKNFNICYKLCSIFRALQWCTLSRHLQLQLSVARLRQHWWSTKAKTAS